MRFLHLADVHLDTPFAGRTSALRERLRDASREALRRAFDLAIREEVDAVLIAGDLFDGPRLSFETERFLVGELDRLGTADIAVVYATGNHDPGHAGLRAHRLPWPDHVVVVSRRTPTRTMIRRGGRVVGSVTAAGHESDHETADLSEAFPRPPGEGPSVALLHTQVHTARSAGEHHPYAPSDLDRLKRSGYDYWALGHVHTRQGLAASPAIHYPGSLQGRTPMESGPRGALLVDLTDPDALAVDFHSLAPIRWETIEVDGLEEVDTLERLTGRVAAVWEHHRQRDPHGIGVEWIVRVRLLGPSPLWRMLAEPEERDTLAEELRAALALLDVVVEARAVHPPVAVEEHRGRRDVLGEALRLIQEVRGGAVLPELGAGDLAAFEIEPAKDVGGYVRSLLDGGEAEILSRLLEPDPS